jgi:tRNA modification GTPase
MEGGLARQLEPVRRSLLELMAHLEASLEFPEEEGTLMPAEKILPRIDEVLVPLRSLASSFTRGRLLRRGATVVLRGAPNVGKSSIFNRLLGLSRAIVTAQAGTTRDVLSESVELGGIPVRLVDTAGLGPSDDPVVAEGVRRAQDESRDADVVLLVLDRSRTLTEEERAELKALPPDAVVLLNKSDLPAALHAADVEAGGACRTLEISALTGAGLDTLESALSASLAPGGDADEVLLTRRRQHDELTHCIRRLEAAHQAAAESRGEELILVDLHEARTHLAHVTGSLDLEDVYQTIFSTFCIGK